MLYVSLQQSAVVDDFEKKTIKTSWCKVSQTDRGGQGLDLGQAKNQQDGRTRPEMDSFKTGQTKPSQAKK